MVNGNYGGNDDRDGYSNDSGLVRWWWWMLVSDGDGGDDDDDGTVYGCDDGNSDK